MPGPDVSVVIPVLNGMPYLPEAVASVLAVSIPNVEIIIRDNGSTDGTWEWLQTIDDARVRVVAAEIPGSAGDNWTAVSRLATGTWVKLLCADDALRDGGLARQVAAAEAHPDAALVASRRDVIDEHGAVVVKDHGLRGFIGTTDGVRAARGAVLSGTNPFGEPSSVLMRRNALQASLPFTTEHPYLTDLDMYVKVLRHGDLVGLVSTDATFRVTTTSWSASVGNRQWREYRNWAATLPTSGLLTFSWIERARIVVASLFRFLGRRALNVALVARGRRR